MNASASSSPPTDQSVLADILDDRLRVEAALKHLAARGDVAEGNEFFLACVEDLAIVYRTPYAFVSLFTDASRTHLQTIALWANGRHVDNIVYELNGTPCEDIINLNATLIPTGAAGRYPNDHLLQKMNIDSYFGSPLINAANQIVGVVGVMHTAPLFLNEWTRPAIGIFGTRISIEMDRRAAADMLKATNKSLEKRVAERTVELERHVKELQSLCYSLSHDLRGPLRHINGYSALLYDEYKDRLDDTASQYLKSLVRSTQHMGKLIDDLRGLFQVTQQPLSIRPVELHTLTKDIAERLRKSIDTHEVKLEIDIDPGLTIDADPSLMRIALTNLLGNAWKYTARTADPTIMVSAQRIGDATELAVRDNGAGFDMQYADKLFNIFTRLHADNDFDGLGIGLAIVKRIVSRHNGLVHADSTPDKGATFTVRLPVQIESA